jgi:flagellin-like protein
MKDIRKNHSAISPVIATILFVVIAVVLAAALYALIFNLGEDTKGEGWSAAFVSAEKLSPDTLKITFGSFPRHTMFTECKLTIEHDGAMIASELMVTSGNISVGSYNVNITSLAGIKWISTGDYITISNADGVKLSGEYAVSLLWAQNGTVLGHKSIEV